MDAVMPVECLASLLDYPDRRFSQRLAECRAAAASLDASAALDLERFAEAIADEALPALQERYTRTFDLNSACTLDMGWHLFAERPERGAFLADLRPKLASAGLDERDELPDYLPHLLKLIARMSAEEGASLYMTLAPAVDRLLAALSGSPYACLVRSAWAAGRVGLQVGV